MGGHLFVIEGDLTKIACDAILIPTDDEFRINNHWAKFLDGDHRSELAKFRTDPSGSWGFSQVKSLECVEKKPQVWLGKVGLADGQLDFTNLEPTVREFVGKAADHAKSRGASPIYDWPLPRLAVNIIGSDHGGGSQKKGHLVRGFVCTLSDLAKEHGVDIILVAFGAKSYAAAQRARRQRVGVSDESLRRAWSFEDAPVDLLAAARELAHQAINSHLVMFIGAGVSMGAGLQPWKDLLRDVAAKEAKFSDHALEQLAKRDPRDQATILERRLESLATTLKAVVASRLEAPCYALTHGLLASLPSREAVTTNFDELFETAWTTGNRSLAILPDSAVDTGGRWLLKLHGTVAESQRIILTRSDYLDMPRQYGALIGLVQGLLMMRHMMFVGYSLQDEDFHELIHEVRVAQGYREALKLRGTVLTLQEDELDRELWRQDLVIVPMAKPKVALEAASRQLEMFLDLVGYLSATSAAFFLDETYDELSKDETALRDNLNQLVELLDSDPRSREDDTVAYKVRHFLREELGADGKASDK
ncbi:hypothetical protein MB901379_03046 [Mycobacterium basiliense]|uniref:Uncharacterized protein n=2 Tax=Mycobacterium basiliense TaxID=2094119 RepID=A0A447GGG3_9MYCO|nr:SIR2 family protein [Mycobacterium basiliense]VDM89469.1 hypothetical protein MB901379_03046 [Mycobacterium basiliense]